MKLFLKNIVFNKHIKYKRYNSKFLNFIAKYFLKKIFPQVLKPYKPIKLSKNNNFNINKFGIKIYSQNNFADNLSFFVELDHYKGTVSTIEEVICPVPKKPIFINYAE